VEYPFSPLALTSSCLTLPPGPSKFYTHASIRLICNKTYTHRPPLTSTDQAHDPANRCEKETLSNSNANRICNGACLAGLRSRWFPDLPPVVAGRTAKHSILTTLGRISFDRVPLQVPLIETTYQPTISFFHMNGITKNYPKLTGLPDYTSLAAVEIRTCPAPDQRFLQPRRSHHTLMPLPDATSLLQTSEALSHPAPPTYPETRCLEENTEDLHRPPPASSIEPNTPVKQMNSGLRLAMPLEFSNRITGLSHPYTHTAYTRPPSTPKGYKNNGHPGTTFGHLSPPSCY